MYALSSAAVTHALARACAQGSLPHYSCAGPPRDPPNGNFKWGGCGDNVRYGALLARQFADAAERRGRASSRTQTQTQVDGGRRRHWALHMQSPLPSVQASKRRKSVEDGPPRQSDPDSGNRKRRLGRAQLALVNLHNNRAGRRVSLNLPPSNPLRCAGKFSCLLTLLAGTGRRWSRAK